MQQQVFAYDVAASYDYQGVVERVNEMLADGWVPLGGIAINGVGRYAQAMVKVK